MAEQFALTPMVFVFVGGLAALTSFYAIRRVVDAKISGLLAAILWFVWGLSAFRVTTITDAGEAVAHNWGAIGWIGFAIGIIMFLDWLMIVFEELDIDARI